MQAMGIFDERKAHVLRLLREAGDVPVNLDDLKAAGIEQPASLIYELELAGEPIEHIHYPGGMTSYRLGAREPPR